MRNIDRKNNEKRKTRRATRTSIYFVVLCIALCILLSSCGLADLALSYQSGDNGKITIESQTEELSSSLSDTSAEISDIVKENIQIEKELSTKEEGDKITSAGQAYNSVSEVYYAVADSVVEITTETVQTSIWMGQYISKGAGSGVIIDESGLIVTNNHVIEGANNVIVRLTDGSEYEATLVGSDVSADLAVIKINPCGKELCAAPLGCSADLVVGEDIIALGNPLGSLGGTLTTGIISATERTITIDGEEMVLLQTNAAINPGNSGGGLFNMAGQLIGIVNSKVAGEDIEGLGFAIPVDYAHTVIEDLINYGYVRGVVDHGLSMLDVTSQNLPAAYRKYGITSAGIIILESKYSAELKYGDKILSVDGKEVDSSADVERVLKSYSVNDTITITVARGNNVIDVKLTLHEKMPEQVSFDIQ